MNKLLLPVLIALVVPQLMGADIRLEQGDLSPFRLNHLLLTDRNGAIHGPVQCLGEDFAGAMHLLFSGEAENPTTEYPLTIYFDDDIHRIIINLKPAGGMTVRLTVDVEQNQLIRFSPEEKIWLDYYRGSGFRGTIVPVDTGSDERVEFSSSEFYRTEEIAAAIDARETKGLPIIPRLGLLGLYVSMMTVFFVCKSLRTVSLILIILSTAVLGIIAFISNPKPVIQIDFTSTSHVHTSAVFQRENSGPLLLFTQESAGNEKRDGSAVQTYFKFHGGNAKIPLDMLKKPDLLLFSRNIIVREESNRHVLASEKSLQAWMYYE